MQLNRLMTYILTVILLLNPVILNFSFAAPMSKSQRRKSQSLTPLHLAAIRGNTDAMYEMGLRQLDGDGFKKDKAKAKKWFERAAKKGHKKARIALAQIALGTANSLKKEYLFTDAVPTRTTSTPVKKKPVIQPGREDYLLAKKYYFGTGVGKDPQKVVSYMRKAANKGLPQAQLEMGALYFMKYGEFSSVRNFETYGREWIEKSARQGNAEAQTWLGKLLFRGTSYPGGLPRKQEALKWFRKAANQGRADAQYFMGDMFAKRTGIRKDFKEAYKWYQKAANAGHAAAQYQFGLFYDKNGGGVVRENFKTALKWYQKAADQGHPKAEFSIGMMYYKGQGVKRNYTQAFKWTQRSAQKGYSVAQNNLGAMYYKGHGVARSMTRAAQWYQLAANGGSSTAKRNIARLRAKQSGVDVFLTAAVLGGLLSQFGRHSSSYDADWRSNHPADQYMRDVKSTLSTIDYSKRNAISN